MLRKIDQTLSIIRFLTEKKEIPVSKQSDLITNSKYLEYTSKISQLIYLPLFYFSPPKFEWWTLHRQRIYIEDNTKRNKIKIILCLWHIISPVSAWFFYYTPRSEKHALSTIQNGVCLSAGIERRRSTCENLQIRVEKKYGRKTCNKIQFIITFRYRMNNTVFLILNQIWIFMIRNLCVPNHAYY